MYGRNVKVNYKGLLMNVFVPCSNRTPNKEVLKERAIQKLQRIEEENFNLTLDEIQEQLNLSML